MNFTSSIIEQALSRTKLTIIVTDNEREDLAKFLSRDGHRIIKYEQLYFGGEIPNLVLCNNKVLYYDICKQLSITYHIPSIVVDHMPKSDLYNDEKLKFLDNLPSSFRIAISDIVYRSWHSIHDKVLPYHNKNHLQDWTKCLLEVSKKGFNI